MHAGALRQLRLFGLWLAIVVVGVVAVSRLDARRPPPSAPAAQPPGAPTPGAPPETLQSEPEPITPTPDPSAHAVELLSVAERSDYTRTATHAETVALVDALAAAYPSVLRRATMGASEEGRELPLLIVASPPVATAAEARASGKVVVFAFGNIHAGEVEGKEALPMLARRIAEAPADAAHEAILRECVLLLAPIYNADGNDRVGPSETNRPGQNGPALVGQRANAQGLDLNRDYTKAEAAETRAMLRLLTEWDPHLIIDCHSTNGSLHRYTLTYEAPLTAAAHPAPVALVREMLTEAGSRVESAAGYALWWYGDFHDDNTQWRTYSAQARFGGNYHGLRNRLSALSEAYTYAPYRDRVLCTLGFVSALCSLAAERAGAIEEAVALANRETIEAGIHAGEPGADTDARGMVPLRHRIAPFPQRATVRGLAATGLGDEGAGAKRAPHDYEVEHFGRFEPTLRVARAAAYAIPPGLDRVVALLHAHGVKTATIDADAEREVEEYTVTRLTLAEREFQGHRLADIEARATRIRRTIGPGWTLVPSDQPLGTLAAVLLEPASEDGVAAWGLLGDSLSEGDPYPILRVPGHQ